MATEACEICGDPIHSDADDPCGHFKYQNHPCKICGDTGEEHGYEHDYELSDSGEGTKQSPTRKER